MKPNPVEEYNRKIDIQIHNFPWIAEHRHKFRTDPYWIKWAENMFGYDPEIFLDGIKVVWKSWKILSPAYVRLDAEEPIRKTNFLWPFILGGVKTIEIVDDPIPSMKGEGATIKPPDTILVADMLFFPGHDFPGSLIHEAVHLWQVKRGILNPSQSTTRGQEAQAYGVEDMFFTAMGFMNGSKPDILSARNINAKESFEEGVGFTYKMV